MSAFRRRAVYLNSARSQTTDRPVPKPSHYTNWNYPGSKDLSEGQKTDVHKWQNGHVYDIFLGVMMI